MRFILLTASVRSVAIAIAVASLFMALAASCSGCMPPKVPERDVARGIVLSVAEAVHVADKLCAEMVRARKDRDLGELCSNSYDLAGEALRDAELLVDSWPQASRGGLACHVRDAVNALGRVLVELKRAGEKIPAAVEDAMKAAPLLTELCQTNGT